MKLATYSIVGDAFEVLPKLIEGFKEVLTEIPKKGIETMKGGEMVG
ncbi:hypothetical protein SDC9_202442 [bioreactor metagenome]|uniref:Uncharacterized protein n=1 Tax=bioreactor metagenome TaxID=1076179 RepID=A0A645ITL7_9ZZZZ